MAYIVNQDIIDRVGAKAAAQLSNDTASSTVNTAVVDEVRLTTEGEVNSYLAKRFRTPVDLTAHPDAAAMLKGVTLDLAVHRLHARRPPVAEDVRKARDDAIAWLSGVSTGKIELPVATTPASTTANEPVAAWGSKPQNAATMRDL